MSQTFAEFSHPAEADGSSELLQEHELDASWKVFLVVLVGGLWLGLSLFTGPVCWIKGRRLRRGYEALGIPVPDAVGALEWIGAVSFFLPLILLPAIIALTPY